MGIMHQFGQETVHWPQVTLDLQWQAEEFMVEAKWQSIMTDQTNQ